MSEKAKSATNILELTKKLENICKSFVKMSDTEKSDSIKLTYFSGLEKSAINLKIPQTKKVEIIFENVLLEKMDLIKSPNILLAFVSFLRQIDDLTFQKYFYKLLYEFSNDDKNFIYFKKYLILFSLEIFYDSVQKNSDGNMEDIDIRKKYFSQIMINDIKEFSEQFFKFVINEKIKLIDNKIKLNFLKIFVEVIIIQREYQTGIILLQLIKEELNNQNFPDEFIEKIITKENNSGFNYLLNTNENINDFLTFTLLLLRNTSIDFIINKKNENLFDFYFANILNLLCIKEEFNVGMITFIFDYYKNNNTNIIKKIFPEVIYHLSNYAYTNNQISFLFNIICLCDKEIINPIYGRIIYKNPILLKKSNIIKTGFKPNLDNIKIIIDNKEDEDDNEKDLKFNSIINNILFINNKKSNRYLLIYLSLYNYIINSSFRINENNYIINFNSLNKTLQLTTELIRGNIPEICSKFLLQFLLDYFSVIFDFCCSSLNENKEHLNIIFKTFNSFFDLFKILANKEEKQFCLVYPSLLNLLPKTVKIELIEPILNYLIETFARKTIQCEMVFKTIKSLIINSDKNNFDNQFFLADKIINIVIESNEHKSFELLFSFCNELFKDKNIFNQNLSQYIINKYSKNYQGALSSLLENHIISKFDENFIQKKFVIENITDDDYNTLNTLNNIYLQDKTPNLIEIVDKLYGNDYKIIISIFNELFEYMDKEENNKNTFNFNLSEDLIEKYYDMKNNLNEIIDFYSFIKLDYKQNNEFYKKNKNILRVYGITYYLIYLLAQYLSDKIEKEKNLENEEEKKVEIDKLLIIFNYIDEKLILNKEIKNNFFKSFFINRVLCDRKILEFYFEKHTNILVNEEIEKKQLDYSKLRELSCKLNQKKSFKIIELLKAFPLNIILIKKLIISLFSYESENFINPNNVDLYSQNSKKYYIIKTLNTNKLISKIKDVTSNNSDENKNRLNNNENTNDFALKINSSFSKIFFDFITDLSKKENLESNQPYYLFCLDNDIFFTYYNSLCDFYDFDYAILELYSLIRNENCKLELKEKFLEFLNKFNFVENVLVFNLRIFSEEITFDKIISTQKNNHSEKMTCLLCDIIQHLLKNLLRYNSYQNYAENCIHDILKNIFRYTKNLLILSKEDKNSKEKIKIELNYLIKLINYVFEIFSTEKNNFTDKALPKKSEFGVNDKLIKNINEIIEKNYNPKNAGLNNNDNKDLLLLIQAQKNLNDKNVKDLNEIYKFIEDDVLISNYNNNPRKYPFPIEQFMDKCGFIQENKEN